MPKFVQLDWLQIIKYSYSKILTNCTAAHKDSEVSVLFKWMPPQLYVASRAPAHMQSNPKI